MVSDALKGFRLLEGFRERMGNTRTHTPAIDFVLLASLKESFLRNTFARAPAYLNEDAANLLCIISEPKILFGKSIESPL